MIEAYLPIKLVAQRTGLSAHVIRVWEKRYGAVKPARTGTNRRLYTDEDVQKLGLLGMLTQSGQGISSVARLSVKRLRRLTAELRGRGNVSAGGEGNGAEAAGGLLRECLRAVRALDGAAFERILNQGSVELGAQGLLQRVIAPAAQKIGEEWREGELTAAHEHFASAIIRVFLGHGIKPFAGTETAPVVVVGTPAGQLHELGALLAGAAAANLGWRVTYLGASLPAPEIAGAARQNRARAVALSLVYPEDDLRLEQELIRLRELLSPEVSLLVGGRAAPAYREVLKRLGAHLINDLTEFPAALEELRKPTGRSAHAGC